MITFETRCGWFVTSATVTSESGPGIAFGFQFVATSQLVEVVPVHAIAPFFEMYTVPSSPASELVPLAAPPVAVGVIE